MGLRRLDREGIGANFLDREANLRAAEYYYQG